MYTRYNQGITKLNLKQHENGNHVSMELNPLNLLRDRRTKPFEMIIMRKILCRDEK